MDTPRIHLLEILARLDPRMWDVAREGARPCEIKGPCADSWARLGALVGREVAARAVAEEAARHSGRETLESSVIRWCEGGGGIRARLPDCCVSGACLVSSPSVADLLDGADPQPWHERSMYAAGALTIAGYASRLAEGSLRSAMLDAADRLCLAATEPSPGPPPG
ncbi:hypothetical protein G4X40_07955 [Rhodococcus sp. D2-41]|uniref:Uncharacterized protein n=1 Tax=Speluncibacter jeojiensis TaxID=2710754 RepID=A0A9X4M0A5_9ACTN|nr:hypothetical protein [Rhodococcus sp. D2-41]MDG3010082.1 hypothetical protein [Rhodococcus sp. D2-41]MDG3015628.1 hypothetical protein [Corynebacteriales bacterium D3-21]